jgi:hypothetical protein
MYTIEIVVESLPELDRFPRKELDIARAWAGFHHLAKTPLDEIKAACQARGIDPLDLIVEIRLIRDDDNNVIATHRRYID